MKSPWFIHFAGFLVLCLVVTGCSRKSSSVTGAGSGGGTGGFLDDNPDSPPSTPPQANYRMTIHTGGRQQFPSQTSFTGSGRLPFAGADGQYVMGLGLTVGTGSVQRLEVIARQLFADGSLGAPMKFINGTNKNTNYTPSGGWDFAWYAGSTSSRILTGISFSSRVTKASVIKRSIGPEPRVGDAVNFSLPNGNPYQNVSFFTVPDYSFTPADGSRAFFVIVGVYLKGHDLEIDQVEVHHHQLYSQWTQTAQRMEFQLRDPRMELIPTGEGRLFATHR